MFTREIDRGTSTRYDKARECENMKRQAIQESVDEVDILCIIMTFEDKPTFENVIFGHLNSTRLDLKYIFERGLVFKCHI